jgi:pantetheine-phosphate adenylyltransferase
MSPTITNISGILESVIAFGRFIFCLNNIRARGEGNIVEEHARQRGGQVISLVKSNMRHCIYPGTFDPITYGHLDVLARAARLFDKVTVSVADNPGKKPLFSSEERLAMILPNIVQFPNVSATTFGGLLVDFAVNQKADAIIRGLRAFSDFEFEFNMALMNRHLQPLVETIFVMPNEQFSYTSSSLVKQVASHGGPVGHFVPPNVAEALRVAFAK